MPRNLREIYQLKVTLKNIRPAIWRRVLVSSVTDLSELHRILQIVMGWSDNHMHLFVAGNQHFGNSDPDHDDRTLNETGVKLESLLKGRKDRLVYEYDFGDGWEHEVVLEEVLPYSIAQVLPLCMAGGRTCPPEDVGGPWGYELFLTALGDEHHPEHHEMCAWVGEQFDPEHFDVLQVNRQLALALGRR
ncbi:MAG: plasmid pRiA4b ORF-3 family protein [Pseudomonadales bacterium]|nr:plasmid pRiA4b ORF-3 family protein [Pseudomonadales bacterium]